MAAAPEAAPRLRFDDESLTAFVKAHGRNLAIGAAVVVLMVFGFWWYKTSERTKEQFAAEALMQARGSAEAGNLPLASSDLQRIIDRYKGTKAADQAFVLLSQTRMLQGQRDIAITGLQEFVRAGHDNYVEASAYALLASGLEDQGKYKDAGDAFKLASQNAELDFLKAQYLIDAGRTYAIAGDTTAARAAYGEVLDEFGRLPQAAEARVRQAEIGGTVPPPPPPIDSTN